MAKDLLGKWLHLRNSLKKDFQIKPDLNGVLFLVGIQELGILQETFTKDEKQDLMHIAVCSVLADQGFYQQTGKDEDGWPIWNQIKSLPEFDSVKAQEEFLKEHIVNYFEKQEYI